SGFEPWTLRLFTQNERVPVAISELPSDQERQDPQ
ncbi:hypothetical protein A2U01_0113328, partial [Trifolium medium]|nr:hypothetical protein [Trifolium medium]